LKPAERHGRGLIAYSLGNFIFAVSTDPYLPNGSVYTNRSFVLLIELDRDGYVGQWAEKFFCRLSYDENLPWVRQIIGELTKKMPPRP